MMTQARLPLRAASAAVLVRDRADSTRGMYLDLGAGQEPRHLDPMFAEGPPQTQLQLADLYAYIAVQAHGGPDGWRTRWFQDLYGAIDAQVEILMPPREPPQWFVRLPDGSSRPVPNPGVTGS